MQVTPITRQGKKFYPMDKKGQLVYGIMRRNAIVSEAVTLKEFMESVGATSEYGNTHMDSLVVWSGIQEKGLCFCGGEVVYAIGIARDVTFGDYGTQTVYLSEQKDGSLKLAIPA